MTARWGRDDWLVFGEGRLKAEGKPGLTLDRLCEAAGRTRGSFYHHFASTDAFLAALVERWRLRATDRIAEAALAARDLRLSAQTLKKLTSGMDHSLDLAVRQAAQGDAALSAKVIEADARREAVVAQLIAAAHGLPPDRALAAARLFHSVHLAGQLRAPDDLKGFSEGPYALLEAWLARDAA